MPKLTEIRVELFAGAAEAVGGSFVLVKIEKEQILLAELIEEICAQHAALENWAKHSRWALGVEFINENTLLDSRAIKGSSSAPQTASSAVRVLAMIPPVSGG